MNTPGHSIPPSAALRPAAWLFASFALISTAADPDLWGHVRFGQDILRDRALPRVDPYSFTQDRPWINHEWLSEVFMGAADNIGGAAGLVSLKAIIVAATIALAWRSLRGAAPAWRWSAALVVAVAILPLAGSIRPQLWTLLLLAVLCLWLTADDRRVWLIPLIFVLWANVHGGWIVGLGVLGAWTFGRFLEGRGEVRLVVVSVLAVLATLVTPYGIELWQFIASTVRLERTDITEWQPAWSSPVAITIWMLGIASVAVAWKRSGRPPLSVLSVFLMLAVASSLVLRLTPLFAMSTVILIAPMLPRAEGGVTRRAQTMVDLALCGAGVIAMTYIGEGPACISMSTGIPPDPPVFAALIEARLSGRMVTTFNWGEAVISRMGPEVKVSIDGRRETVFTDATLKEQAEIRRGTPAGLAALARLAPDFVWLQLPVSRATYTWLKAQGYRIDLETDKSFVAVRADLPRIMPASEAPPPCYPFAPARRSSSGQTA